ncbi:THAP domain-containing protein 4-like [Actinia tenebrosa]|uniref:THAP domain-containing protein 4-like n=1 Tax=Actinia tenebrosa TaxID=6105 RepID=A0A6P8HNA9_ACTTE|nr:THAP domain-containing protein 4-like [Actinia tenebrosa]
MFGLLFRSVRRPFCFELSKTMSSQASSKPPIDQALTPISWLIGKWKGEGCGIYPTISPFTYLEEVTFDHFGKPILTYDAKSFSTTDQTPMHYESGFLRIKPGTTTLAFMVAQNAGISEVEEGEVKDKEIHLLSHTIGRMTFGADPKVTKVERIYRLTTDQDTMEYIMHMETDRTPHAQHLHITYKRVKDN